jgi:hypothetical protein
MEEEIEEQTDFLEVDPEIPGQNYACISFLSPEKIIKQRETYMMYHFVKWLNHQNQLTEDNTTDHDHNAQNGYEHGKRLSERGDDLTYEEVKDAYEDFLVLNEKGIYDQFCKENDFRTSVRGLKIRGVYNTLKEAKARSQAIRRRDPKFNVFIGQVGYWLPWDPDCNQIEEVEYQEQHLNELMKKYTENSKMQNEVYEQQKAERLRQVRENTNKAKEMNAVKEEKEKIEELRDIADKKERLIAKKKASGDLSGPNVGSASVASLLGNETVEEKKEVEVEEVEETEEKGKEKKESNVFDEGPYADPWMEAKARTGALKKKIGTSGNPSAIVGESPLSEDTCVESVKIVDEKKLEE